MLDYYWIKGGCGGDIAGLGLGLGRGVRVMQLCDDFCTRCAECKDLFFCSSHTNEDKKAIILLFIINNEIIITRKNTKRIRSLIVLSELS